MKLINTKIKDGPKIVKSIISKMIGFLKKHIKINCFKRKFPFDIISFKKMFKGLHLTKKPQLRL